MNGEEWIEKNRVLQKYREKRERAEKIVGRVK